MRSDEWARYVKYVIGDDDQTTAAARVGVSQPTVGRWLKGMVPDHHHVAALAEEYDRDVLEAFVAAGLLTVNQAPSLSKASRVILAALFSGEQPGDPPSSAGRRRQA
jgi:transcriptional regulator with XRE-family HTH domain